MDDAFGRSYMALGYLFGVRGEALRQGVAPSPDLDKLDKHLSHADRAYRAKALARELAKLGQALAEHRLQ